MKTSTGMDILLALTSEELQNMEDGHQNINELAKLLGVKGYNLKGFLRRHNIPIFTLRNIVLTCRVCNKEYTIQGRRRQNVKRKYCSKECSRKYIEDLHKQNNGNYHIGYWYTKHPEHDSQLVVYRYIEQNRNQIDIKTLTESISVMLGISKASVRSYASRGKHKDKPEYTFKADLNTLLDYRDKLGNQYINKEEL